MNNVDWRQILGVMKMKGENEGKIMFSGSENRNLGMRIATPRERERERCHTNTTPTKWTDQCGNSISRDKWSETQVIINHTKKLKCQQQPRATLTIPYF